MNGGLGRLVDLWQKRMCLTELRPQELREHSSHFGPFALEFALEEFLQMGGMPVFYLPAVPDVPRGNEGLGATLMTRLAEVNAILQRIEALADFGRQSADKNAPFGQIVKVMDAAKESGIKAVNAFTKSSKP